MAAQQIGPRPRIRAACSLCHISKTKCKSEGENNDPGRCDRCQSLGLQCSYPISTKRRGRPPKDLSQLAAVSDTHHASAHVSSSFPYISGLTPYTSNAGPGWMPESAPASASWPTADYTASSGRTMFNSNPFPGLDARQAMGLSLSTPQPQVQVYNPTLTLPLSSTTTSTAPTAPIHIDVQPATISPPTIETPIKSSIPDTATQSEENVHLNLSEYLDPKDSNLSLYPPRVPFFMCQPAYVGGGSKGAGLEGFGDQDPVSLGMLSNAEASMLVNKFHEHLNPTIAVLDPKLHTLDYLLQTSPILLSAVLAASSKHYYKPLSPSLLAHTKTILDRALSKGRTHISLIQSLMILTYTKPPEDTSGWMRIGTAVRMGYQMFLHVPRVGGLPADEKEARVVLNAERTWYCLFCFDRSIAQCVSLPSSIRLNEIGEAETWAREHLHLGKSPDMHLAASIELCKMKDQWRAIFASETPSTSYCESAIESLTAQAEALYTKWFGRGSDMPNFSMETEHVIAWCILDFIFSLKRQHYEMSSGAVMRMEACLASASQIVDRLEILSRQGVLAILQDTVSCMTSALGIFLHKIFWTCTILQKSHIANLLQRVLKSHESAAEDPTAAPAYVARCFKRILAGIGSASRGGSPMPNTSAADNGTEGVMGTAGQGDRAEQDLYLQLEEFVRFQEGLEQYETVDEQFWQTLFSA